MVVLVGCMSNKVVRMPWRDPHLPFFSMTSVNLAAFERAQACRLE